MQDTGLKDKTVIVTGANHGIGAATALAFAREGAKVFIPFLRLSPFAYGEVDEEEDEKAMEPGRAYYYKRLTRSAEDVMQAIQDSGGTCKSWETDLAEPKNSPELFDRAERAFGHVISPGAVQTGWLSPAVKESLEKTYPLRRIGEPEDIANAVIFFASRQADWITGQVLHVGGGNKM